ncbi:MAG TPA: Wzz/FepE/Etk N-terminal domain-containing protein [Candidatus Eisenbacteria bacterium]|nr:Wzz/FepE/Etk N-terminal domain-containing protein [Candidatus Eisenbacteria bacterium]
MESESQQIDVREILFRVGRYRWLLVLPPVAALCIASIYFKLSPVVYESHVTVSLADQANMGSAIQSMVNTDRERATARERMTLVDSKVRSRAFLDAVAERLGLLTSPDIVAAANQSARRYPDVQAAEFASRLANTRIVRQIRIIPLEGTFVRITAMDNAADKAQRLASTITDLLIEESRRTSLERVQARGEFSQDQLIVQRERVRENENAYQSFQESLLRRALTSTPVTEGNVDEARGIVRATNQEIEQTRDRVELTRQQWDLYAPGQTPPTLTSRNAETVQRRLANLETSLAVASVGGERSAREVPKLQSDIAATRQLLLLEYETLAATAPGVPDAARSSVAGLATDRAILRSLISKRESMTSYIGQFGRTVENSPREQMELARLRSALDTSRDLLVALEKEAQSSRLSEAFASSAMGPRLTVIDPPQLPLRPATPDPLRIFGGALLLGPLLSVGLVIAGEKFSLVIRTVEQAEQEMGARILGTVPKIEGWTQREGYIARHWAFLSIVLVLVITGVFHSLNATILSDKPHSTQASPSRR